MSIRSTILAAAAVAATALSFGATPALAQSDQVIAVPYGDLNLASDNGVQTLDRRIANAAVQLCGTYSPREFRWFAASRDCQEETIAATQPQRDAAVGQLRGTVRVSSLQPMVRVSRAAN